MGTDFAVFSSHRYPNRLLLSLLALLLVVPVLAFSVIQLEGPRVRQEAQANLAAIGKLKEQQIAAWLVERRGDAGMLMARDRFIGDVENWLRNRDPAAEARIARRRASLHFAFDQWEFHAPDYQHPDRQHRALIAAALASGRPQLGDLYRDRGQIWIDHVLPLIKLATGKPVAVAILRLNANTFLFPLIQTWPTPSPSAETLLVRRDGDEVMFLNELRHRKRSTLTLRHDLNDVDLPAAVAVREGKPLTLEGVDYRGIPVLAAVRPVNGTPWFLVAKIDRDEVLAPLFKIVTWVSAVSLAAILLLAYVLLLFWRQQQRNHALELLARTSERDRLLSLFYDLPFMGMAIIDPNDDHWLHVNERLCEILGYSHEELVTTTTWQRLTHPDDLAGCLQAHRQILAGTSEGYQMAKRFIRRDGSLVDVALAVKCVRRADGSVEYLVKTVRDISDHKRLEEARTAQMRATSLLEAIAAASPDAIFAKDVAGQYLFFNNEAARQAGRRPRDVIGHDDRWVHHRADAERIMAMDSDILADGEARTFEETLLTHDGPRTFLTTKGPLRDGEGRTIGLYGIARDITERKLAEDRLRRQQEQLQSFIEHAPISIAMFDRNMHYLAYSRHWLDDFGQGHDSLIGLDHYQVYPDLPERWLSNHRRCLAGETLHSDGERWSHADGSETWMRWAIVPWRDEAGEIGGIIISSEDISERRRIQTDLAMSRARLAGIIDSAMDAIVSLDAQQRIHIFNPAAERMFGYTAAQMLGQSIDRLIPDGMRVAHQRHMTAFSAEGVTSRNMASLGELHALHHDGTEFPIEASISKASVGEEQFFTVILRDIGERRRASQALRASEERYRSLVEQAADGIFVSDDQGNYIDVNSAGCAQLGYRHDEILAMNIANLIDPAEIPRLAPEIARLADGAVSVSTWQFRRKDGTQFPGEVAARRLPDGRMQAIVRDISERRAAEQALREREEDLNRAQTVAHIGSWRLDVRHNQLTWSEENHRIFGIQPGNTMSYETFLACVHPEDRAYVDRMWQAALQGAPYDIGHRLLVHGRVKWVREKAELEFDAEGQLIGGFGITQDITDIRAAEQALRESEERFQLSAEIGRSGTWDWNVATGAVFWSRGHFEILGYRLGEVLPSYQAWINRVHPDDRMQVDAEIRRCMESRADYMSEFRVVWPDDTVHWMSARGRFEYNDHDQCQRMLGVMAEVTSLKQAELALREADQRKDEFLAMLAHELRNPLAPIRNAAHVLGRLGLNEPRVTWAQNIIERQVAHLTHLVDELLDVSRIARGNISLKKTSIDLADLIHQACESAHPLLAAKQHRLETRIPETPVKLEGDPVRLVQVLQNLLNNAAKYTPDGGCIRLQGRQVGKEIEIQVEDNGVGIPGDLLPGVFDLFRQGERTLDRSQGGLGIGLTLVKRLVELHGGRVSAHSAGQGLGATFKVWLPAMDAAAAPALPNGTVTDHGNAPMRVLVVDDDAVVAESMAVFLQLDGHDVRSVASGEAALAVLPDFRPQVVLLDIGLPGQDGYEVARLIRQQPGGGAMKLVAVSGYGHEEAVNRGIEAGFDHHMVKPVDPEKLSALLRDIAAEG